MKATALLAVRVVALNTVRSEGAPFKRRVGRSPRFTSIFSRLVAKIDVGSGTALLNNGIPWKDLEIASNAPVHD